MNKKMLIGFMVLFFWGCSNNEEPISSNKNNANNDDKSIPSYGETSYLFDSENRCMGKVLSSSKDTWKKPYDRGTLYKIQSDKGYITLVSYNEATPETTAFEVFTENGTALTRFATNNGNPVFGISIFAHDSQNWSYNYSNKTFFKEVREFKTGKIATYLTIYFYNPLNKGEVGRNDFDINELINFYDKNLYVMKNNNGAWESSHSFGDYSNSKDLTDEIAYSDTGILQTWNAPLKVVVNLDDDFVCGENQ